MRPNHLLSDLQMCALKIAWQHLGCDDDVDGLTNELLAAYFPPFEQHRRKLIPRLQQLQDKDLETQFRWLCQEEGWEEAEKRDWFEQQLHDRVRFRDLLGRRQSYPGRFFEREAIGETVCDAAFAEMSRALQSLARQNLIRTVGNVGFVLTDKGIALAQSLFPNTRPQKPGNPFRTLDDLSIRRTIAERRDRPFRAT